MSRGNGTVPIVGLRHYGRWIFDNAFTVGDNLQFTFGQTTSFADTIDFNTMLGGLGAALRRNPRGEAL